MVKGKWFSQGSDIGIPLALRQAVFSRGRDPLDEEAQQVVVFQDEIPVGAARLWWAHGAFQLGDVGVLEDHRGQGFGDLLVRLLLYKALTHHARQVRLITPLSIAPFFARYGFVSEEKSTQGATQVVMCIQAEAIQLDGCAHCNDACPGCQGKGQAVGRDPDSGGPAAAQP